MSPYTICHVRLEEQTDIYDQLNEKSKYYFLFWWRQVLLGHMYKEENEMLDRDSLQLKIIRTIQPCIDFYQSECAAPGRNYINAFLKGNQQKFTAIMQEIFLPYEVYTSPHRTDISVIICTHSPGRNLYHCLQSLHNQEFLPQEIIVVDNTPSDETVRMIVEKFPNVLYCKEEKTGLSAARNTGVRLATSPIVAFVDEDVTVHPLWSLRVWQTFLPGEVKAMTGQIIPTALNTESQQRFERYRGFTEAYCDKEFDSEFIERRRNKAPGVWFIGAGANMAFRKSVFDSAGYFDERLGAGASGGSEDSELWFRLLLNGYKIRYNPRAIVCHTHPADIQSLKNQLYHYTRGQVAAALMQHKSDGEAGYRRLVLLEYPKCYLRRLINGFPLYRSKNRTLFSEIKGWYAGIRFFRKHCPKPTAPPQSEPWTATEPVNPLKLYEKPCLVPQIEEPKSE